MRNTASVGAASATKVRSSRSSAGTSGSTKRPRPTSVASGVSGTTVSVNAERNAGSIAVARRAEASACASLRSTPPAPSRKMADSAIPAAWARRAASTWAAWSCPFAMRLSVTSSPDSGPM
ncbi:MAG: hypothetical protein U0325_15715 [Polyangiales bacterium]